MTKTTRKRARIDGERTKIAILLYLQSPDVDRTPAYDDIARAVRRSRSNIHSHVRGLAERGLVRIEPGPRGIMLTDAGRAWQPPAVSPCD